MTKHIKVPEGTYIAIARGLAGHYDALQHEKDAITRFKQICATEMHKANIKYFTFQDHNNRAFAVTLGRPTVKRINVRKLYVMLGEGEITLDEFFDCVTAPAKAVTETLGEERTKFLWEEHRKSLDLVVKELN